MSLHDGIADLQSWIGPWPFRDLPVRGLVGLGRMLAAEGVTHALVSSLATAFRRDLDTVNRQLLKIVAGAGGESRGESGSGGVCFFALPTVDPSRADALEAIESFASRRVRAVLFLPSYHDYSLSGAEAVRCAQAVAESGMIPVIQIRIEDERSHHPRCHIPPVAVEEILELAERLSGTPLLVRSASFTEALALLSAGAPVFCDISYAERLETFASLVSQAPVERLVFGSHAPLFYPRAAVMKLHGPGVSGGRRRAVAWENAAGLLGLQG